MGTVLSQLQEGWWHPVAYLSKSFTETQRNYEIYNKELLAIMEALQAWHHYLIYKYYESFEIWTDHQNQVKISKPQKLNRRRAHWVSELANYDFVLRHKSWQYARKPDLLSRPPCLDNGVDDNKNITFLPEHHFLSLFLTKQLKTDWKTRIRIGMIMAVDILHIKNAYIFPLMPNFTQISSGSIMTLSLHAHPGQYKTHKLITRDYWWPRILAHVKQYIQSCEPCQHTKVHHEKPHNPLRPHPIPTTPWEHISINLISPLPHSCHHRQILQNDHPHRNNNGTYLSQNCRNLPRLRSREQASYGLPRKVVSDRAPQFIAQFMLDLYKLIGIQANPSTVYHPQTDGQNPTT